MLRGAVQPPLVSLFSSTSSSPFAIFSTHVDLELPEDSGIILVRDCDDKRADLADNDATQLQRDPRRFKLRTDAAPTESDSEAQTIKMRGLLQDTVLHIQSPTIRTTFIRCPPLLDGGGGGVTGDEELGLELPFLHLQFRRLGSKPFLVEVGVRDIRGRRARIRLSNFQTRPALYLPKARDDDLPHPSSSRDSGRRRATAEGGPILHLPLSLPPDPTTSETSFTPWLSATLSLGQLMPHLNDARLLALSSATDLSARPERSGAATTINDEPQGTEARQRRRRIFERFERFHSISHVEIHANMRLRRVWCSKSHDAAAGGGGVDELSVFAAPSDALPSTVG